MINISYNIKEYRKELFNIADDGNTIIELGCHVGNTTKLILDKQDPDYKKIISDAGLELKNRFVENPSIGNFLDFSFEFSKKTNLMSDEVSELIDYFNSIDDILGSSMAMLGNTVFAFAYNEDVFKNMDIEGLNIYELDNIGIKYDKH